MAKQSQSSALDTLEASIKTILLQTGSTFADPTNYDSGKLVRTRTLLKLSLPPALTRFHDALDELERDLIRARAVLHRDLVDDRARQTAGVVQNSVEYHGLTTRPHDGDVDMTDGASHSASEQAADGPQDNIPSIVKTDVKPALPEHPDDQQPPTKPSINGHTPAPNPEATNRQIPPPQPSPPSTTTTAPQPPQPTPSFFDSKPTAQPTTTSAQPTPDSPSADADLFENSIFGSPTSLANTATHTTTGTNANLTPAESSALNNIDVNSLLPGLEFYANDNAADGTAGIDAFAGFDNGSGGGDFFGSGDMAFAGDGNAGGMGAMEGRNGQMKGGEGDVNFEDFFASFGGAGDAGGGGMGGSGGTVPSGGGEDTNFDESFFNLDG